MNPKSIARLTEQQRACLRHVYAHRTSKEIAPILGIEPGSVDQHIKAAMRILDVGDRRTAARVLAEYEAANDIQPLVYQPLDIARPPDPGTFGPPIESGWHSSGLSGGSMREEQAFFRVATPGGAPTLPLPIGTTRPGDLGWLARLGWIIVIMMMIALTFGVFLAGVEALSRIGRTASF